MPQSEARLPGNKCCGRDGCSIDRAVSVKAHSAHAPNTFFVAFAIAGLTNVFHKESFYEVKEQEHNDHET